jgi:hypothetical protein
VEVVVVAVVAVVVVLVDVAVIGVVVVVELAVVVVVEVVVVAVVVTAVMAVGVGACVPLPLGAELAAGGAVVVDAAAPPWEGAGGGVLRRRKECGGSRASRVGLPVEPIVGTDGGGAGCRAVVAPLAGRFAGGGAEGRCGGGAPELQRWEQSGKSSPKSCIVVVILS